MVIAAILAGGIGSRMGSVNTPKQYLRLGGKTILAHTAEKFLAHPEVERVLVLAPKAWLGLTKDILGRHDKLDVIEGGDSRNNTLRAALCFIEENFGGLEGRILVTHDAVRPFVTHRIISENIAAARIHGACDTVVVATDTIVRSEDGAFIQNIPPRRTMYQGQTPQSFRASRLRELMDSLLPEEEAVLTDGCMIYALRGEPVALVRGEDHNFKITYPYDMTVAHALLGLEESVDTPGDAL